MILSLALAAALATSVTPRAAKASDSVVHVPRVDALGPLNAWMTRAGEKAALLRPSAWTTEFHPLLRLDPTRPETLAGFGVDAAGAATISLRGDGSISCTRVSDGKKFAEAVMAALSREGALGSVAFPGGTAAVATTPNGMTRAGFFLKGTEACAFAAVSNGEALRKEAQRLTTTRPASDATLSALPGVLYVVRRDATVGLTASGKTLSVQGRSSALPIPALASKGASNPYAGLSGKGLMIGRANFTSAGIEAGMNSVTWQLARLCRACDRSALARIASAVGAELTGAVAFSVDDVKVRGSLADAQTRFFAPRQAMVAEARSEAGLEKALAGIAALPGAKANGAGHSLTLTGGTLHVRRQGKHVFFGNDDAATSALMAAVGTPAGKLAHGLTFEADPRKIARGLSQISLLDLAAGSEIAALFAVSSELGPLLADSASLSGWADGGTFQLSWSLP